jgi:hypothetical protein
MLHCNSAALASSDMSGRAYKILMEMEIWRDRLDHILEWAGPSMRAHTGKDAVNMRTGSHK